jgi:hypothetical protein
VSKTEHAGTDKVTSDTNSICDLTKTNTSEILQKIEFQFPIILQGYTELFTKYLHSFDLMFGTCRISEKQFLDKLGINHSVLEETASYWNLIKNLTIFQIEACSKFLQDYFDFRVSTMETFDKSMHLFSEYYAQTLFQFYTKPK